MIVACMVVHNEAETIAHAIRSVKAYVDRFVVVDAVFDTNPVEAVRSTDDTHAVAHRMTEGKPLTYWQGTSKIEENVARNLYLDELAPGDWALVVDGDEVLYGGHAQIEALIERIRAGEIPAVPIPGMHNRAVGIPVYTQRVHVNGSALDVTLEQYETAPITCSVGVMARFFEVDPGIRYPEGPSNQGLFRDGRWVGRPAHVVSDVFMVNHRIRQSHEAYQADYEWLSKVREAVPA